MNKWTGIGRVTKDIELKKTPNGKSVATFTLAVNRRTQDDGADFIQCVAWNKTAEILSQYVRKGHRIGVTGHISTRNYESNGRTVYVTEVVVEEMEFLESKTSSEAQKQPYKSDNDNHEEMSDYGISDDDLPF